MRHKTHRQVSNISCSDQHVRVPRIRLHLHLHTTVEITLHEQNVKIHVEIKIMRPNTIMATVCMKQENSLHETVTLGRGKEKKGREEKRSGARKDTCDVREVTDECC